MLETSGVAIQGAAGDEHVRTGGRCSRDGVGADPAVHFDIDEFAAACGPDHLDHLGDLGLHGGDVLLPAEPRVDRHHQHEIDEVEHVGKVARGSRRVEGNAGRGAERCDVGQRAVEVGACLGVHDQALATGAHVLRSHRIGSQDHEVSFERQRRVLAGRGDHVGSERQVGDELAVHHVPLDPVDAGGFESGDLVAQLGEVGR